MLVLHTCDAYFTIKGVIGLHFERDFSMREHGFDLAVGIEPGNKSVIVRFLPEVHGVPGESHAGVMTAAAVVWRIDLV